MIELHFRVTDTGIGISSEKREMIFAPFTQADGSTTRLYGGTGLGLAISSQLVTLMGGRLWVESELGRGSTFHFTSRFQVTDPGSLIEPASLSSLEGLKVLVVDDNGVNRRILEEILEYWRMKPTLSNSGRSALIELEQAKNSGAPFSLVLLDAMMPEMDGFAVAERIKSESSLKTTVILMLTSSDRQGFADLARDAGIAACLNKPIHQNKLLDAILDAFHPSPSVEVVPRPPASAAVESRPLKILMAEDNPHNQRVAMLILTKAGHSVTLAADGQAAVKTYSEDTFDVVIMDLQMPFMDGFQATAAIRGFESGSSRRVPIIALTAHAMVEDRNRCLAAGMDGYVSKPIQAETLLKAIHESIDRAGSTHREAANVAARSSPMDLVSALQRVDGDQAFLAEMARIFLQELPAHLHEIREALLEQNAAAIVSPAHKLKNWTGNFDADPAYRMVSRLEELARIDSFDAALAAFEELEDELQRLSEELRKLDPRTIGVDGTRSAIEDDHRSRLCIP
jgi:CheY-like chemotaxis protein